MNGRTFLSPRTAAAAFASLLILAGCATARRSEPVAGPMPLDTPALQRGKVLYDTHCYKCHQAGEGGLGPGINDKPLPQFLMGFQIRHGLGVMPGFNEAEIGDEELKNILEYLVALRRHGR